MIRIRMRNYWFNPANEDPYIEQSPTYSVENVSQVDMLPHGVLMHITASGTRSVSAAGDWLELTYDVEDEANVRLHGTKETA